MTETYLIVTTIIIDQKIRLSTPKISVAPLGQRMMAGEGLAEGVDRAGADVAEDDADRADRKRGQASPAHECPAAPSAGALWLRCYRSSVRIGRNVRLVLFCPP